MPYRFDSDTVSEISALAQGALRQINIAKELWFDQIHEDLHLEARKFENEEYIDLLTRVSDELIKIEMKLDTVEAKTKRMAEPDLLNELAPLFVATVARANNDALIDVAHQIDKACELASTADNIEPNNEQPLDATATKFVKNKLRTACEIYNAIITATQVKPVN